MNERLINIEKSSEHREGEPGLDVPIIDIVRHGETSYKEILDPNFKFDPKSPDFKLDAEHLDLNETGIANIRQSAEQLAGKIDRDNEVVLLLTSPNFRAQSSALLIQEVLKERGIPVIDKSTSQTVSVLRQIQIKDQSLKPAWSDEYVKFLAEDPSHASWPMMKAHQEVANRLGITPQDAYGGSYQKVKENFENFIRHMTNIRQRLSSETQAALGNKRIRVVAVTHEELPAQLLDETLEHDQTLLRGQIMELQPDSLIEQGKTANVKAILYPKGDQSEEVRSNLKVSYKEDKH